MSANTLTFTANCLLSEVARAVGQPTCTDMGQVQTSVKLVT